MASGANIDTPASLARGVDRHGAAEECVSSIGHGRTGVGRLYARSARPLGVRRNPERALGPPNVSLAPKIGTPRFFAAL